MIPIFMKKLHFKPFQDIIQYETTAKTRSRYTDNIISSFQMDPGKIRAVVHGTGAYDVAIDYTENRVIRLKCSCPYEQQGYCKHIVHVLAEADERLLHGTENTTFAGQTVERINNYFVLENQPILELTSTELDEISVPKPRRTFWADEFSINEARIMANEVSGELRENYQSVYDFTIIQRSRELLLKCSCENKENQLCRHLNFVLKEILRSKELQLSFDHTARQNALRQQASSLGMNDLDDPDSLFEINVEQRRLFIQPKFRVLALDSANKTQLQADLLPAFRFPSTAAEEVQKEFLVVSENPYSDQLQFQLMSAPVAKNGDIKSPVKPISLHRKLAQNPDPASLPFLLALLRQDVFEEGASWQTDLHEKMTLFRTMVQNPLQLSCYLLESTGFRSSKITPKSLQNCTIIPVEPQATIHVNQQQTFYTLTCTVEMNNKTYQSKTLKTKGEFFIQSGNQLLFLQNESVIRVLKFFRTNKDEIFLHQSQFAGFQEEFLNKLEQTISVKYSFVKPAPAKVIREHKLDQITEHLIYLSESDDYILITPVLRYGETEVPVLSRRTVYTENPAGGMYSIERNEAAEHRFIRAVQQQHPDFSELTNTDFYYLHKRDFLDEGWFVDAFENWRSQGFVILGFNQLKNNRLNPHKMKVQTKVLSGIDWFDVHSIVSFGSQEVSLKEIQKSVLNKSRYVTLGDGTQGILPEEWIQKFGHYFRSGELKGDIIRAHKSHFQLIDELFEREQLSEEVRNEMELFHERLAGFQSIRSVAIPAGLNATLRDYQKEGLNWLHFLNDFGFGGCLADDMGLGKTIQIIAYLLSLRENGNATPHLIVVPTSLLFNWQAELDKFAPDFRYLVIHGSSRETAVQSFQEYGIILTTYGTMLSDIEILRKVHFDCIILDESQAIKNTESKRYKASRLLQARQRLVLTGTPVENNTFDLFAQLSFAMPGLLGTAKRFATDYSTPIDKFQDTKRAKELQLKIHPFVLRRTKKQVARELPEKTEMIIYCEMQSEQRRVYDTYKKEFREYLSGMSDKEVAGSSLHILQGMTKLRQICDSPALLSDDAFYGDQSAKLEELMAQIMSKTGEHKMLVFSQFVGMLELIRAELDKAGIGYAYLTGQTRNRQEQVELFQSEDAIRVFLISLKAGGTGLNLTSADYVFIVDPWWNPAVENQAIDRAYRIGQDKKVVAIRLITPDTIEEKMLHLQERKRELAQDLIHTDANVLKQLTKEDLMNLV